MAKTEERLRNQGFGPDILTIRKINFANIDEVAEKTANSILYWQTWGFLPCRLITRTEDFLINMTDRWI